MFEPGTHISLTWVSLIPEKKVVKNAKVIKVKWLFLTLFVKTLTTERAPLQPAVCIFFPHFQTQERLILQTI